MAPHALAAEGPDPVAPLADRERDRDVQIPIEVVALVVSADLDEDCSRDRHAVALHRVSVARGRLVEVLEVRRTQPEGSGDADAWVGESLGEGLEDVAGDLHRWIQLEHKPATGHAQES